MYNKMNPVKQFNKLNNTQKVIAVLVLLAIVFTIYLYLSPRPANRQVRRLKRRIRRQARKLGLTY